MKFGNICRIQSAFDFLSNSIKHLLT